MSGTHGVLHTESDNTLPALDIPMVEDTVIETKSVHPDDMVLCQGLGF